MKAKSVSSLLKTNISYYILIAVGVLIIILLAVILYKVNKKNGVKTSRLFSSSIKTTNPITGYWMWTWGGGGSGEPDTMCDIGIRFGGDVPRTAIDNNIGLANTLTKCREKFLNLGGGLETGIWNISDFDYINSQLNNIKSKGWDGICFDVEVCTPNVSFVEAFAKCFTNCKDAGLKVLVTMSHTNPYQCQTGIGQGMDLVNAWIKDTNIDYISPQLYTQGEVLEQSDLSMFANAPAKIIPSIPYDINWPEIQNSQILKIKPAGYLAWLRNTPPTPTTPIPTSSSSDNYCGTSWADACTNCLTAARCPNATDGECPAVPSDPLPQKCWGKINCSVGGNCPGGGGGGYINCPTNSWDTQSMGPGTCTSNNFIKPGDADWPGSTNADHWCCVSN
jgi:hypothetical protein